MTELYLLWKWEVWTDNKFCGTNHIQNLWRDLNECLVFRIIGSYTSPFWRSGISSTSVINSVFSRVERSGTSGKTLNFSHEWKKSQIFDLQLQIITLVSWTFLWNHILIVDPLIILLDEHVGKNSNLSAMNN